MGTNKEVKVNFSDLRWTLSYHKNQFVRWLRLAREYPARWKRYWASCQAYRSLVAGSEVIPNHQLYPCLYDDTLGTDIEPIYYYQDAWAFEHIVKDRPASHVDIGSHHKFVALLSKVLPVTMIDIRPPSCRLDSLQFQEGSILALPFETGSLMSVSSICVIEHIGLGRYGDPIDVEGTVKASKELMRVLAPGGKLYISVPIASVNKTHFNAHRAFTETYIAQLFEPYTITDRKYIYGNDFVAEYRDDIGTGLYRIERGV
jgi:SAM-dependent methyltransferase